MHTSTKLIPHLSNLPSYGAYSGILLANDGYTVVWDCGHAHSFNSTALECAEYEKTKRSRSN